MTILVITRSARADISDTIDYLEHEAGGITAGRYAREIQAAINRLVNFPESGAPRSALGELKRMVVIYPYLMMYDYEPKSDVLTILRVLHGKSEIRKDDLDRS